MTWTHEHTFTIAATPERVFAALTDGHELTQWFAEFADVDPREGGRYRFWGRHTPGCPTRADATQTITSIEPGRALGFTWMLYGVPTDVRMSLAAKGEGTSLIVQHTVQGDLPMPRSRELVEDSWGLAIGNLMAHLTGGAGMLRADYADPAPEVRLVITIDAPRTVVFRALMEPEMIAKWFGGTAVRVEPRVGGDYDLGWKYQLEGRDVAAGALKILQLVPDETLVLSWPDWRGDKTVTGQTISFGLESVGESTRVTFVHAGFGRTADIGDFGFGWPYFLGELTKTAVGAT